MSDRSIRRAAERKLAKLARKAERACQLPQQPVMVAAAQTHESSSKEITMQTETITAHPQARALAAGATAEGAAAEPASPDSAPKAGVSAAKLALGAEAGAATAAAPSNEKTSTISAAKAAANRANAQLSTGPRSSTGKAKASLNAIQTGLTGQTVVLPTEDIELYRDHVLRAHDKYKPYAPDEEMLVQAIADTEWRLARIPALEAAIQAIGMREFAGDFEDEPNPHTRQALIRGKVAIHYQKNLSNLALQERRLRNHREKDIAELRSLQDKRRERRNLQYQHARTVLDLNEGVELRKVGFDFTTEEFEKWVQAYKVISGTQGRSADFDEFLDIYRNEVQAA